MDYRNILDSSCDSFILIVDDIGLVEKEIYDYIKYLGKQIRYIVTDKGIKYNGHFENTPIIGRVALSELDIEEKCMIVSTSVNYKIDHASCRACLEPMVTRIEKLEGNYQDNNGNIVENHSDSLIPHLIIVGSDNKLVIGKGTEISKDVRVEMHTQSAIIVGDYCKIGNSSALVSYCDSKILIGNYSSIGEKCNLSARYNSEIILGDECFIRNDGYVFDKYDSKITIGNKSTFEQRTVMISVSDSRIKIGENCMGSFDVSIIGNDGHALSDSTTGKRYNTESEIVIGDNVWLGIKSSVLSGSKIPDGMILGAGGCVTKKSILSEGQSVAAGMPAQIVKKGVRWERYI